MIDGKEDILKSFEKIGRDRIDSDDFKGQDDDWVKFENVARTALQKELGCILSNGKVNITGKVKDFDLVNIDEKIVGDIKHYKRTESGNNPSAKFSTLNEYVWLMQRLEQSQKVKWRKILVVGEDLKMLQTYVHRYGAWLDDIQIYYCSNDGSLTKIR